MANNPSLPVKTTAGGKPGGATNGSLDIDPGGMSAVIKDVTEAKESAAPDMPYKWTASNPQ